MSLSLVKNLKTSLHQLIDPVWKQGKATRDTVYKHLSQWCDESDAHVSTMTEDQLQLCIGDMLNLWEPYRPCSKCKNNLGLRYGVPLCKLGKQWEVKTCDRFETII